MRTGNVGDGIAGYYIGMCVEWQAKQHCERGERGECETCLQQDLAKPKELEAQAREIAEMKTRLEQTEVQLAGCGVAALGWSRCESAAKPGDYGYSASYGDVLTLRQRCEAAEDELEKWRTWDDKPDEWSEAIDAAFPTRSGSHAEYAQAMTMVGNRHSKGELVALVNWLLVERKVSRADVDIMTKKARKVVEADLAAMVEGEKDHADAMRLEIAKRAALASSVQFLRDYAHDEGTCAMCDEISSVCDCPAKETRATLSDLDPAARAMLTRLDALEAVAKYAVHTDSCAAVSSYGVDPTWKCDCGAQDALDKLRELDASKEARCDREVPEGAG